MIHWKAGDGSEVCENTYTLLCYDGDKLKDPLPDLFICKQLKGGTKKIWAAKREVVLIGSPDFSTSKFLL